MARDNFLGRFGSGLSRFGEALANPVALQQREALLQQQELAGQQRAATGQALTGQFIPQFLQPGGAEALTPGERQQSILNRLAGIRGPEAFEALTQLSPLGQKAAQANLPSSVREFQFFQDLSPEQQEQFLKVQRADPLVSKGLQRSPTGEVSAIPGFATGLGQIEQEREAGTQRARTRFEPGREAQVTKARKQAELQVARQAAFPKLEGAFQTAAAKSDVVTSTIDEVLPRVGAATAGFGSLLGAIPGTPAADLAANIDTILANVGFEELQAMRDNSPTGGALGQVAVRELELLQATRANISNSQSPAQLKRNLIKLRDQVAGSRERLEKAFNKQSELALQQTDQETIPTGESIFQQRQPQEGEGTVATNPQTGQKLILRGGQWQPL